MNKLESAIYVYKKLCDPQSSGRNVTGTLLEDDYNTCKEILEDQELLLNSWDEDRKVEIHLPSHDNELFVFSIKELLEAPKRMLKPPTEFYVASNDFLFKEGHNNTPELISNYLNASQLASALIEISDHALKKSPKAIFLHGEKLELPLSYSEEDLRPLENLDQFIINFVHADIHKDQKATIIKVVLIEMLKSNEIDRLTLPCLIKRFDEFIDRINANYQLYVSEFSFDKIKSQLETEKFEFTLKLNKVFSEIQNQLLAVPIALLIIGSQMKQSEGFSLMNTSIWCGSLVFGLFMSLLIRNQKSTLNAIKLEMESQWSTMQRKHKYAAERLGFHYKQLNKRYLLQRWFLFIISLIISISIAGSTIFFIYNSNASSLYKEVFMSGMYGGLAYTAACLIWNPIFEKINTHSH